MRRKTSLIFIIMIGFLFAQTEKGISIKSKAGNEGKRWAICIGINEYEYEGISKLKKAQNDAEALGDVLKSAGQFDYVFVMTDKKEGSKEYPTASKLRSQLNYLQQMVEPNDLVVFSFSGHGISKNDEGYLIMVDSDPANLYNTSVKIKEVTDTFKKIGVKKSLLLVDACREEFQENKGINKDGLKADKFEQSEVAATFYATKAGCFSYEDDKSDYGAFTNYVLKGLEGEADKSNYQGNSDGIITFSELKRYVEEEVTSWAMQNGKVQKPYTKLYNESYGDLALASYLGVQVKPKEEKKITPVTEKNAIQTELTSKYGVDMIGVEGGLFQMGDSFGKGNGDEKPVHSVTLSNYYIGKYEVTQAQWMKVMGNNPSSSKGSSFPVESVSWYQAVEFCNKLSEMEGLAKCYSGSGRNIKCNFQAIGYRLPTEAEWEFAARGGNKSRMYMYSGSDNISDVAEFEGNNNKSTKPVGGKKKNELGIYDMSGNIWEYCNDFYSDYKSGSHINPTGANTGVSRVIRGGSWLSNSLDCRVVNRGEREPTALYNNGGFRVVRSAE